MKNINMERNMFMEMDGLAAKTDTHEWFYDKIATQHAQREDNKGIALKNIAVFIVRNMETGEYDRVVMDIETNQPIYDSKSIEDIGFYIDKLKVVKQFDMKPE